jgi:DNA-binding winged helix-turn-helix (wHTH) protein/Tfp pilus assembly protein PilF
MSSPATEAYEFGPYRIDPVERLLYRGDTPVLLAPKVTSTLLVLVQNAGHMVDKDTLIKAVWPDTFVEEGALTRNISLLRRTLGDTGEEAVFIETIPRRGYRFIAPVQRSSPADAPAPPAAYNSKDRYANATEFAERMAGALVQHGENPGTGSFLSRRPIPAIVRSLKWLMPILLLLVFGLWMSLPAVARWYNNRGVGFQRQGKVTIAIANYQQAIKLRPDYAEAHYNLADAYEEISDYDKAIEEYRRSILADNAFYPAYNNLSRLYILRGDYASALSVIDRGLSLKPRELPVQYSLYKNHGWANIGLRLYGQAELDLRRALALGPDGGAAYCLLAQAQEGKGERSAAVPAWESCVAYGSEIRDVEPAWRSLAQERLRQAGSR